MHPGAQGFNHHGGDGVAVGGHSPAVSLGCPCLAVCGGVLSPKPTSSPRRPHAGESGSSWAETRPPRLIRPVHVSTRPVCRVLAPANESDYGVLPHLPESPGSFPRARETRRGVVKGPRKDLGYGENAQRLPVRGVLGQMPACVLGGSVLPAQRGAWISPMLGAEPW